MITEKQKKEFKLLSEQCREIHIPVVREKTAELLCSLVEESKPKNILEIGTAVGYSGTLMLLSCPNSNLTTLEINQELCNKARDTFAKYNVQARVEIINQNALDFLEQNNKKFDFIFVDGPKGQYIKYLPYLKSCLAQNGIMFCDDVLYFGMVQNDNLVIHKKITIVRNLREFIKTIQQDPDFSSELLDLEDGVLIVKKIK